MDFIEEFPMSDGKDKNFVVVDRPTKYTHFMGVKKANSPKQIAEVISKKYLKITQFPKVMVNDRDAKFKGNFLKEFCKHTRISLNMSSIYHP